MTDKGAELKRPDGGVITPQPDGSYIAHTLLTWTGLQDDGVDYSNLPNGAPGLTKATLRGTFAGTWTQNSFTDPFTQQPYTTDWVQVNWTGSAKPDQPIGFLPPFTPPTPYKFTNDTSFSGDMPDFDKAGTSPKTETWIYQATDQGDKSQVSLQCQWYAHYANENWVSSSQSLEEWSVKTWSVTLGSEYNKGDVYAFPDVQPMHYMAPTKWTVHDSPGFDLCKYHIGVADVRDAFGQTKDLYFNPDSIRPAVTFSAPGIYQYYWWAKYSVLHGTVDVWNVSGAKVNSGADFAPCSGAYADGSYVYLGNGM